jgi:tetratricopeptide (TPR) repeat protein
LGSRAPLQVCARLPAADASRARSRPPLLAMVGGIGLLVLIALAYVSLRPAEIANAQPILVVPFENLTGDAAHDALSTMAADWITQGIAATGAFEVVPARTVLTARRYLEGSGGPAGDPDHLRALVRETGARSIVTGSYFLQGDSLFFHSQITRARDNRVLAVVDRAGMPLDRPVDAIDLVRQRVLAAIAPLDPVPTHARAAVAPPTYDAYRAYVSGMEAFVRGDPAGALVHFERSATSDESYPMPLIAAAIMHTNLGNWRAADSIASRVDTFRDQLGTYEAATLDMLQAWIRGDDAAAYEAVVRQARIAPGTISEYQVAEQARRLNRPREALRVLQGLRPDRGELRGWRPYWREITAAHHMLGNHRRELAMARRARSLHPDDPEMIRYEARALVALGRVGDAEALVDVRLSSASRGYPSPGAFMLLVAGDFSAFGHAAAAASLNARAVSHFRNRVDRAGSESSGEPDQAERDLAYALYAAGELEEAEIIYRALLANDSTDLSAIGRLGILAARRGDVQEAARLAARLAHRDAPYQRHLPTLWRARISAQLDEPAHAVALLQEAFSQGLAYGTSVLTDIDLAPLKDYQPYRDLMRPQG